MENGHPHFTSITVYGQSPQAFCFPTIAIIRAKSQISYLYISLIIIIKLVLATDVALAQPAVPKPKFNYFKPVSSATSQSKTNNNYYQQQPDPFLTNNLPIGGTAEDVLKQVQSQANRQMGVPTPGQINNAYRQNQIAELNELKREEADDNYANNLTHFQSYFSQLLQLNPDKFSITKAVYLTEAVFYERPFSYNDFLKAINQRANFVKQILKQENLSSKNNSAVNYAIQELFSQDCLVRNTSTKKNTIIKKIGYDFEDFSGDKDWTKMFVTILLQTNSGQCHSLPLLYLCIAEQLNTKAWLSLAPEHSFIQFLDARNKLNFFETTNGHLVSLNWMLQSNAISSIALKNKTYLDTLSSVKLYAQCLADFQMTYLFKNGYDRFTDQINDKILQLDPTNINALMYNANLAAVKFSTLLKQHNMPPKEQIPNYPDLQQAQAVMLKAQEKVNNLGYQDMPKEQYLQWLQSIEIEKAKHKIK